MGKQIVRRIYHAKPLPEAYDKAALDTQFKNVAIAFPPILPTNVFGAYTAQTTDHFIFADATTAAFTVTLPNPADVQCMEVTIKKVDASGHAVTVGGTVDGAVNPSLASRYNAMTVYSDGVAWWKRSAV